MPQNDKTFMLALGAAVLIVSLYYARTKKSVAPLPPGPRGVPIFGNITDLPQSQPWLTFSQWAKIHGLIVHLRVLGTSIIVLNDVNYAAQMLDKKSRIYSNRPNVTWLNYRRLLAQSLDTRSEIETSYNHIFETATNSFLRSVLQRPDMWKDHGYSSRVNFAGAIVLKITYGYQAEDKHDPLVKLVDDAMDQFSELTATNAFAVDTLPLRMIWDPRLVRFVPQWFPGAGWKKKAAHYHQTLQNMLDTPYDWVKKQMVGSMFLFSFISDESARLWEPLYRVLREDERLTKWAAAGIYSGVIETFFLAMVLRPDAQRKAQLKLDTVLGQCNSPRLADRPRLPYTEALISEIFRTYSIGPIGLPHVAAENDVHSGFFIPKDAIILTNNWLFYRDKNTYTDPEIFRPERSIETVDHAQEKDPRDMLFGYGRSVGVHLADMTVWLLFTFILVFLDISAAVEDGLPVVPSGKFSDGSISHPEHFKCTITPRKGAEEVIYQLSDD
ncbi:cytochrome P450 [Mycena crocata]|nr:cytochrome P450 [Mycena crocata]